MKTFKYALKGLAAAAIFGAISISAHAGSIANTKHNLGNSVNANNRFAPDSGSSEICVFCHTPHASDVSASVPLWNKKLPAASGFSTYDQLGTTTLDGGTLPVGSVSLACLSCHDGSQAMNTMLNLPGSGGIYDKSSPGKWAGTWNTGSGRVTVDTTTGKMVNDTTNHYSPAVGGDTDSLKNDHPIGIQYCGGWDGSKCADVDFKHPTKHASRDIWWVDTDTNAHGTTNSNGDATAGTRGKQDMFLYTRTGTGKYSDGNTFTSSTNEPFVECASCHDPHTENTLFLRLTNGNTGSQVCLACHSK